MGATANWNKVYDDEDKLSQSMSNSITKIYDFKCSTGYATGGESIDLAANIGLDSESSVVGCHISQKDGEITFDPRYDFENDTVKLFDKAAATEVTNGTNVNAPTFRAEFTIKRNA